MKLAAGMETVYPPIEHPKNRKEDLKMNSTNTAGSYEEVKEVLYVEKESKGISIGKILYAPIGLIVGLVISKFPLSLPVLYVVTLLFMK